MIQTSKVLHTRLMMALVLLDLVDGSVVSVEKLIAVWSQLGRGVGVTL